MKELIGRAWPFLALAVLLRVGYMLAASSGSLDTSVLMVDSHAYVRIATNVLAGDGYSLTPNKPTAWREPGYPAFLAAIFAVAGKSPAVAAYVQIALQIVAALLAGLLAHQLFGRSAALIATALFAISPPLVWLNGYIVSETLYLTLLLCATLAMLRAVKLGTTRAALLAGLLFGVVCLVKESTLAVIGLLLFWWLIKRRSIARGWLQPVAAGLVVLAVVAPWLVRNRVVFGKVLPLHVHGGFGLYVAYHPTCEFYSDCAVTNNDYLNFVSHFDTNDGWGALAYQETLLSAAKDNIRAHPWFAIRQAIRHVLVTWSPSPESESGAFGSRVLFLGLHAFHWLMLATGLFGLWLAPPAARPVLAIVTLAFPTLGAILSGGHHRYIVPVLPFILIGASGTITFIASRLRRTPWPVRA